MKRLITAIVATAAFAVAAPAWAADATLYGSASQDAGFVKIVSDTNTTGDANDFGGVKIPVPAGLTVSGITSLTVEYNLTDDTCGGGSPRFEIQVGGQNLFLALGALPNFTCAGGWTTATLVPSAEARYDLSKFVAGGQYSTWAQVTAAIGSQPVQEIRFVVDGGWSQPDKEQTVYVRNIVLNGVTYSLSGQPSGGGAKLNAAQLCKAQQTAAASAAAFNELWGTNATAKNAFGKCVSTVAHARNAGKTQEQILAAIESCKAQGKKGAALGACVAATDGVSATLTEAQEAKAAKAKAKGKKK